jgi:subtilisin family serine protease
MFDSSETQNNIIALGAVESWIKPNGYGLFEENLSSPWADISSAWTGETNGWDHAMWSDENAGAIADHGPTAEADSVTGLSMRDDYANNSSTRAGLGMGSIRSGVLETLGDRDWFQVYLNEGTSYIMQQVKMGLADPLLNLRDSNGNLLASDDDGGGSLNSRITYTAGYTGVHFLDAGAYANAYRGMYLVGISATRAIGDDFSANSRTTGKLAIGSLANGNINTNGDHDWFKISLNAGQTYDFRVDAGTLGDPFLTLHGADGSLITSNDNALRSSNALIRFTAQKTNTYYLDVSASQEAFTGTYTLSANLVNPNSPSYSSIDGYGEVNVQRALEILRGSSLTNVTDLGSIYWGLDRVGAPEAWNAGVTGLGVTIAVVDTGVDYNHVDLDANIWTNTREIADNGIDDDANGFIDDIRGWDFIDRDNTPMDLNNHGTHVAGIIAAENNGIGTTGVAYNSRIMPVRILDANGSGTLTGVANGIRYAANNGANVINLSLGAGSGSTDLLSAIRYATSLGSVVVMAAGNGGSANPSFPAAYSTEVGLAVGAIDAKGALASFSNRAGSTTKDYVTAAGVSIASTIRGNQFGYMSGTSMATPHAAGAVALIRSMSPALKAAEVESLIARSASYGSLTGYNISTNSSGTTTVNAASLDGEFDNSHGAEVKTVVPSQADSGMESNKSTGQTSVDNALGGRSKQQSLAFTYVTDGKNIDLNSHKVWQEMAANANGETDAMSNSTSQQAVNGNLRTNLAKHTSAQIVGDGHNIGVDPLTGLTITVNGLFKSAWRT